MPHASYTLTPSLLAAHGGAVLCLHEAALGGQHPLYASRPGPTTRHATAWHGAATLSTRLDAGDTAPGVPSAPPSAKGTPVTRVDIRGALEKEAGYHDPCSAYTDGHDAVAARMIAALEAGDVLQVIDSPGGAGAGLFPAVAAVQAVKDRLGRRITAYVPPGGQLCSAALAWSTVADETFAASDAQIGSIGARASHTSIAGALAAEGVVVSYSYWPGPGKIANAPELPQDAESKRRADRDVAIVGETFGACVLNSAANVRRVRDGGGLTMESIGPAPGLDADTRIGAAAIDAGMIDGIDTLENVTAYALAQAESGAQKAATTGAASARTDRAMSLRAQAGDDKPATDDEEGKAGGTKPDGVCKTCGTGNPVAHKFCAQCGESMAAAPLDDGDDDKDPPSSKNPAAIARAAVKPIAVNTSLGVGALLGADGESPVQIKTAAIRFVNAVAKVTGTSDPLAMLGALAALPTELAAGESAIRTLAKSQEGERAALIRRLNVTGHAHLAAGQTTIPTVDASGRRTGETYVAHLAEMKIPTLREYTERHERTAPARKSVPFTASEDKAKAASDALAATVGGKANGLDADGKPTQAAIDAQKKNPRVLAMFNLPGNEHSLDALARQHVITLASMNGGAS